MNLLDEVASMAADLDRLSDARRKMQCPRTSDSADIIP